MTQNLILAKLAAVVTLLGMVIMIATKTDSENTLTASPTVGVAPLEVAFTGYGSGMSEGVMVLDFNHPRFRAQAYICGRRIVQSRT